MIRGPVINIPERKVLRMYVYLQMRTNAWSEDAVEVNMQAIIFKKIESKET